MTKLLSQLVPVPLGKFNRMALLLNNHFGLYDFLYDNEVPDCIKIVNLASNPEWCSLSYAGDNHLVVCKSVTLNSSLKQIIRLNKDLTVNWFRDEIAIAEYLLLRLHNCSDSDNSFLDLLNSFVQEALTCPKNPTPVSPAFTDKELRGKKNMRRPAKLEPIPPDKYVPWHTVRDFVIQYLTKHKRSLPKLFDSPEYAVLKRAVYEQFNLTDVHGHDKKFREVLLKIRSENIIPIFEVQKTTSQKARTSVKLSVVAGFQWGVITYFIRLMQAKKPSFIDCSIPTIIKTLHKNGIDFPNNQNYRQVLSEFLESLKAETGENSDSVATTEVESKKIKEQTEGAKRQVTVTESKRSHFLDPDLIKTFTSLDSGDVAMLEHCLDSSGISTDALHELILLFEEASGSIKKLQGIQNALSMHQPVIDIVRNSLPKYQQRFAKKA